MYCVVCGAPLPEEARYCWRCGYRARRPADPQEAEEPPAAPLSEPTRRAGLQWVPGEASAAPAAPPPAEVTATSSSASATGVVTTAARWRYRSPRSLATAITVLAGFAVLGFGLDMLLGLALAVNPKSSTYDALGVGTAIGLLAVVPMVVVVLVWTRRVTGNLEPFDVERSWGTGWAIGAWFVPLAAWLLPMFVINQAYKATDPGLTPPVGGRWRERPSSPLYWTWWGLWFVANVVSSVPWNVHDRTGPLVEAELVRLGWAFFFGYAPLVAAAVLGAIVVQDLTNRQDAYARRWLQTP